MKYVYIIRSLKDSRQVYVGLTGNLKERFKRHNRAGKKYTTDLRPWVLETYVAFRCERKAREFERYLKSGSGVAFRKRRF